MRLAPLTILLGLLAVPALAQDAEGPPPTILDNVRRQQGELIQVCTDKRSVGGDFDRAVAQAIGDALLVEVKQLYAPSGFPLNAGGFLQELQIAMNDYCDMVAGITLQPNPPYSSFATVTRAYATVPFVLAVTDPGYRKLADIPHDRVLGTAIGSAGEQAYLIYQTQVPPEQSWIRLPYADPELMLRRLRDGTLAGMILWQPTLEKLLRDDPDRDKVYSIPMDPVPEASVRIGALVSSRDAFLRSQVDAAIDALVDDGTIAELMQHFRFAGSPGG
jgi:polar amino acid transport system substrate-binding protein